MIAEAKRLRKVERSQFVRPSALRRRVSDSSGFYKAASSGPKDDPRESSDLTTGTSP